MEYIINEAHNAHEIKDITPTEKKNENYLTFSDNNDNENIYMLTIKLEDGTRYTYS